MQHYVVKERRLSEKEAILIFHNLIQTVNNLHEQNIVHRDLKLGNLVLDRRSHTITITNFCLGKKLIREDDMLRDQRGSPAYVSPDVLCGKPYRGKPSDMWSLGVVLYTMLYGQFPFYDSVPLELFRKIKAARYTIPHDGRVSEKTRSLISRMLEFDPGKRIKAGEVLQTVDSIIMMWRSLLAPSLPEQVVPEKSTNSVKKTNEKEKNKESDLDRLLQWMDCQQSTSTPVLPSSGKRKRPPQCHVVNDAQIVSGEERETYERMLHSNRSQTPLSHRTPIQLFQRPQSASSILSRVRNSLGLVGLQLNSPRLNLQSRSGHSLRSFPLGNNTPPIAVSDINSTTFLSLSPANLFRPALRRLDNGSGSNSDAFTPLTPGNDVQAQAVVPGSSGSGVSLLRTTDSPNNSD